MLTQGSGQHWPQRICQLRSLRVWRVKMKAIKKCGNEGIANTCQECSAIPDASSVNPGIELRPSWEFFVSHNIPQQVSNTDDPKFDSRPFCARTRCVDDLFCWLWPIRRSQE